MPITQDLLIACTHGKQLVIAQQAFNNDDMATISAYVLKAEIVSLELLRCQIPESAMYAIAHCLKETKHLAHLSLHNSDITCEAGTILGEALLVNKTLTSLDLSKNLLLCQGASAILYAIENGNTTLTELNLSACHIGELGMGYAAKVIQGNPALQSLNLSYNTLSLKVCFTLATCFKPNHNLRQINLMQQQQPKQAILALCIGVLSSSSLFSADLDPVHINAKAQAKLAQHLQGNRQKYERDVLALVDQSLPQTAHKLVSLYLGYRADKRIDNQGNLAQSKQLSPVLKPSI